MQSQLAHLLSRIVFEHSPDSDVCTCVDDYSGRGMYGQTTSAIVVDDVQSVLIHVLNAIQNDDQKFIDQLKQIDIPTSLRQDSMGRSIILY